MSIISEEYKEWLKDNLYVRRDEEESIEELVEEVKKSLGRDDMDWIKKYE